MSHTVLKLLTYRTHTYLCMTHIYGWAGVSFCPNNNKIKGNVAKYVKSRLNISEALLFIDSFNTFINILNVLIDAFFNIFFICFIELIINYL